MTAAKSELDVSPDNLSLAKRYWSLISGDAGYDGRSGSRVIETFRCCALKSDDGLLELVQAFRNLANDASEYPRAELFDPPLENALRRIARQSDHSLSEDAAWILSHIDIDD